jgi:deoxyribodipyrimidine photo-lyase
MSVLPPPQPGEEVAWVRHHLGDLCAEPPSEVAASPAFRGGQTAADARLAAFDVTGYASDRNEVWPPARRGASGLSPYIRHGLLPLRRVWDHVGDGPPRDVRRYRDELAWQEYARHLYARLGRRLGTPLRVLPDASGSSPVSPWDRALACVDVSLSELERDGWMVNQTRMWLASHWTVRHRWPWLDGEDAFFTHLLDGSRAANRLGWQWTVGAATGRPYGFSRAQVERRAPGLCRRCPLSGACPIEDAPPDPTGQPVEPDPRLRHDPDPATTAGPTEPDVTGCPQQVWLTAESLGDADPALQAHPGLPAVFVLDETLLARLRLSGKRLVFLAETLADLATRRPLEVHRGDPTEVLAERRLAVTFTPVPGWRRRAVRLRPVAVHPYPWLARPGDGPLTSFSAWRRHTVL